MEMFMEHVKKENIPEYYDVIKEPMCFRDIKNKLDLENDGYESLE